MTEEAAAPANEDLNPDHEAESRAEDNHDYGDDFDVFAEASEPEAPATEEPEAQPAEAEEAKPEDAATEIPAEPEVAAEDPQKIIDGLNAALLAEREKKRDAQIALEAARAQKEQQPKQAEPEQKAEEFNWDNPQETIARVKAELRQENQTAMLNMSEAQAMARHEDYGDKYATFVGMATENPSLVQKMLASPDPAEFAYQEASKKASLDEIGEDPAAYKARIKAEILAELKADKTETLIKKAATPLPPSASAIKGRIAQDNAPVIHDDPLGAMWGDPDR